MRPMRYRNYRLYWVGYFVSNAGSWMQSVAQGLLILNLGGSALALGAVGLTRALPLLALSFFGGALADRIDRRYLLFASNLFQGLSALALALLTAIGVVQVWHVLALSALSAVCNAFEHPARQAMIPSLVDRQDMMGAIVLNSIAFNGASVFGPSVAAVCLPFIGLTGCFVVNGISFVSVLWACWAMDLPKVEAPSVSRTIAADLRQGLRFVLAAPVILALLLTSAWVSFFARGFSQFMPVVAFNVLHTTDRGFALLSTAPGVGTIIFSLLLASLGDYQGKGRLLVRCALGTSVFLVLFAWTPWFWLSYLFMIVCGGCSTSFMSVCNTLLHTITPTEMRGRVMSLYTMMAMAMMPLGQFPMGAAVEWIGVSWALTVGAVIAVVALAVAVLYRSDMASLP